MNQQDPPRHVPQFLRVDYTHGGTLDESDLSDDPIEQFDRWFKEAIAAGVNEPNALSLATVSPEGEPSVRVVLLKDYDARGFTFYTNYTSHKGRDIASNPRVSAVFYWKAMERQVRVDGVAEKVAREESEAYFQTRPREAQIGAWASPQSEPIESRAALAARFDQVRQRYPEGPIPLPPFWGGYRIVPQRIEFWQGRGGRLHDRLVYQRDGDAWRLRRLSP